MKNKINLLFPFLTKSFWFLTILFLEIMFIIIMPVSFSVSSFFHILLFTLLFSSILSLITNLSSERVNMILTKIICFATCFLFALQCVFYKIFKVYFSFYNLGLSDQLTSFLDETVSLIVSHIFYIFLFFLPFILFLMSSRYFKFSRNDSKYRFLYYCIILFTLPIISINIYSSKDKSNDLYDLYFQVNNVSLNIYKLGVMNSYVLDIHRLLFGFSPKTVGTFSSNLLNDHKTYSKNVLDFDFPDTNSSTISMINDYISQDEGTYQNEYTGMFQGYNLIYITAESFSEVGISPHYTPTLYRLTHSGFQFQNFYTPNVLSTIGGEFQSLTGLYPDYSILSQWRSGENYFPFGLAYQFQKMDYRTFAYHNNSYLFQNRYRYMNSQGFDNFLACGNGLEKNINCDVWPQSDLEMFQKTIPDYLSKDNPFMAYYMTVSGHFAYSFDGNYIASKNYDIVKDMNVSDEAKAYVATQIELDRALEYLIKELDDKGVLDRTVIVLMADHYPYELSLSAINELSDYPRNSLEVNHNSVILWNSKMEDVIVSKPCMSSDLLPTVYNLFGIPYDSRLMTGRDILSDSLGIAIMSDYSWISEKGVYDSNTDSFDSHENVSSDYVDSINRMIQGRLTISRFILETDYYKYLFPE